MVNGDQTNVGQGGSASRLDSVKGNGHVQPVAVSQACFENGDSKIGNVQGTLEKSTFGVILKPTSQPGTEEIPKRRTDRVKIVVKRKVLADESGGEGRSASPNKKQKAGSPFEQYQGQRKLPQVNGRLVLESSIKQLAELEAEFPGDLEQQAITARDACRVASKPSGASPKENGDLASARTDDPNRHGTCVFTGSEETNNPSLDRGLPILLTSSTVPSPSTSLSPTFPRSEEVSDSGKRLTLKVEDNGLTADAAAAETAGSTGQGEDTVSDVAERVVSALEPAGPILRDTSGGDLQRSYSLNASTPFLLVPSLDIAEDCPLSSRSRSNDTSSIQSPQPSSLKGAPSSVSTPTYLDVLEDVTADEHQARVASDDTATVQLQSREALGAAEENRRKDLKDRRVRTTEEDDEQRREDAENKSEDRYESWYGIDARNYSEDKFEDKDNAEALPNGQNGFDEEESSGNDFRERSVLGQRPEGPLSKEAPDTLRAYDLSYDDIAEKGKSDDSDLQHDIQPSTQIKVEDIRVNEECVEDVASQSEQLDANVQQPFSSDEAPVQLPCPDPADSKSSFQKVFDFDLPDKGENEVRSVSPKRDSNRRNETTCHVRHCQPVDDTQEQRESSLGVRTVQQGNSNECAQPFTDSEEMRSVIAARKRAMHALKVGHLSPKNTSPSSEVLEKPETSEMPEKLSLLDTPKDRVGKRVKVEVKESTEVVISSKPISERSPSNSGFKRLKVKMSTEISVKKEGQVLPAKLMALTDAPTSAKGLIATGILAGYRVRYQDRHGKVMLKGRINETGIVCGCCDCKGKQTVNVSAFEKHAGSNARHPSDFIYLENGKNLHEVMEAGWKAAEVGRKVSEALYKAMGPSPDGVNASPCAKCGHEGTDVTCYGPKCSRSYHLECAGLSFPPDGDWQCHQCGPADNRRPPPKSNVLIRDSSGIKDSNANMHKALFVPGGLPDDTEVAYYVKGQKYLTGVKKSPGILCSCCDTVISCSQFEQHAGWGSRRNPYSSIYLADGRSLHIAALALGQRKGSKEAPLENVDYCTECGDGGDLVLCDSCPGAYHPECAGLTAIPDGNWFCPRCKNQRAGRKTTNRVKFRKAGETPGRDKFDERCTRLLPTDTVSSGCVFCRSGEFEKIGFGPRTILLCDQCEREYHVGCLKKHGLANLEELPEGEWFCSKDCRHIHSILRLLVANGIEALDDSIISKVIESKKDDGSAQDEEDPEKSHFGWQLLHGRRGDPVNGKTLSQAATIFSDSFDPIVDESSGRDLIPLMVHSRNIRDQDFAGMHCVVLKHHEEVVSAALVRIFGRQFAELPLVATKPGSTGKGYCKALIMSVERLLGVLNVERLVLPAAEGAEEIWVKKFAFSRMSDDESRKYRSEVQMMIFKGSSMLQKSIPVLNVT